MGLSHCLVSGQLAWRNDVIGGQALDCRHGCFLPTEETGLQVGERRGVRNIILFCFHRLLTWLSVELLPLEAYHFPPNTRPIVRLVSQMVISSNSEPWASY